jgi:hypothetical protein
MASRTDKRGRLTSDAPAPTAKSYRVAEGTQVHHDGRLYTAGEKVNALPTVAEEWVVLGLVEEVESKSKTPS